MSRPKLSELAQRADEHLQDRAALVEDYADMAGSRDQGRGPMLIGRDARTRLTPITVVTGR